MKQRKVLLFQVDAFAGEVFRGNPAAVCPLEKWLPDETLQNIALENNLSETAFFTPSERDGIDFELRWFTPAIEVDLCGHATLATAHVVFHELRSALGHEADVVRFHSRSGPLAARRCERGITLDFPSLPPEPRALPAADALGAEPSETFLSPTKWLAVFESEREVRELSPDFAALAEWTPGIVIATAPAQSVLGRAVDFVSRVFAPGVGIPEDPVTGSAHSVLTPYWSKRLGKRSLTAFQASKRGGFLECELRDDRVALTGQTVLYLNGTIDVPI